MKTNVLYYGGIVGILNEEGRYISCGTCNYGSADVAIIKGANSDKILSPLGHEYGDEVIHRNNMVVL